MIRTVREILPELVTQIMSLLSSEETEPQEVCESVAICPEIALMVLQDRSAYYGRAVQEIRGARLRRDSQNTSSEVIITRRTYPNGRLLALERTDVSSFTS